MTARKLEKHIDTENNVITLGFQSGERMEVKMSDFPEEIVHQLALHGLSQKATDATAGKDPDESEKRVRDVISALQAGDWTVRGSGTGGGGVGRVTQLVEAVARIKNYTIEQAKEVVSGLSDDDKKNLQKSPTVQAMILTIKQEKLAAKESAEEEGSDDALDLV